MVNSRCWLSIQMLRVDTWAPHCTAREVINDLKQLDKTLCIIYVQPFLSCVHFSSSFCHSKNRYQIRLITVHLVCNEDEVFLKQKSSCPFSFWWNKRQEFCLRTLANIYQIEIHSDLTSFSWPVHLSSSHMKRNQRKHSFPLTREHSCFNFIAADMRPRCSNVTSMFLAGLFNNVQSALVKLSPSEF